MKKSAFKDRFAEYFVTLGASVAWAVNLCYFLVWNQQITAEIVNMIFFPAVILFLFFYKKIFAKIAVGACLLAAIFVGLLQLNGGAVTNFISDVSNAGGLIQQAPHYE